MPTDTVVLKVPQGTKARWIKRAFPGKLGPWVIKMIDEEPNPERYIRRVRDETVIQPDEKPLTQDQVDEIIRRAYLAGAARL